MVCSSKYYIGHKSKGNLFCILNLNIRTKTFASENWGFVVSVFFIKQKYPIRIILTLNIFLIFRESQYIREFQDLIEVLYFPFFNSFHGTGLSLYPLKYLKTSAFLFSEDIKRDPE